MPIQENSELHILIVEDNEMDQLLIKRELSKSDILCAVEVTDNKVEFIKKLEEFKPDLILCDFSMPQFGALAALEILKVKNLNIPVIIVTGTLTDEMAVECLKKGAIDYILKEKIIRLPSAIKIALDLTRSKFEKIVAEDRLRQNEKQLQVITAVLPASLAYISRQLKFIFCNKVNEEWFGKDITGHHIQEILGESVAKIIESKMPTLLTGGQFNFESRLPHAVQDIFASISVVPDVEKDSGVKGFVILITNITDRKKYEEELKAAKKQADAANEAKSQFLANMSHEIRTPLNAIMGLSELLLTAEQTTEEKNQWAEKILRNSEHLKSVIDEVLDLSKVESGKMSVQISSFSVPKVIAQIKSMLSPLAHEKKIEMTLQIEGSIPEFITSDIEKLRHILLNILGNAIKFSAKGPITLTVRLDESHEKPQLEFRIRDRGVGVSEDERENLFKPFTQIDNSMTRKFGGTGLGLSLARKLAQALGGDVQLIESIPGQGSTFGIRIDTGPIQNVPRITRFETLFQAEPLVSKATTASSKTDGTDFSVLLVEDSEDNQYLVKRFLEIEGIHVDVASDGQEGVASALAGKHDLVLMDIQMPVLDGYNATSRLRQQGYKTPILAFTAHAFQSERERCLRIGFSDFLAKPIKKSELMSFIEKYKRSKRTAELSNSKVIL
ncbi:MAG: hypothetical protein A2622_07220 [Bdellovibrionales bacterium RIFCSPHIGHO2_01_FULL_40_29]|nr:MAG: hypothetical protein A2622_07220 [Bdellovibrionales bacterium RIFCSPHIGHO2_01_FULL_40_29]OFZ33265.1 MAG: hypothetical protein A3D17_12240 [Bdellovibrionales bacterium RIFCSPHIGHO2_02_FULL_40_15]